MWRIILIIFIFASCDKEVKKISETDASNLVDKELLKNIDLVYTDSGKIILRIIAPEMLRSAKGNQTQDEFRKGITATFYNNGILSNTLTANYANRITEEGKTFLSDQVVLKNPKGEKLETAELTWDERNGRVSTDKFVRLSRAEEIVQGYGFESDQNFLKGVIRSIEATFPAKKIMSEEIK
ncbi:MAG: LPS export ABC transporter periplasmic protein LptC [Saprospiraceae bacterium]|nr:LPS export ABC transporter periplasmic protein LptC [Saprospiraceae bacterium]